MKHTKSHLWLRSLSFLFLVLIATACGTSSVTDDGLLNNNIVEAGNPPSSKPRKLQGSVDQQTNGTCKADAVEFYDTADKVNSAEIGTDCSFSLENASGKAWGARFLLHDAVVATMLFRDGVSAQWSYAYYQSADDDLIDFGEVRFSSSWAFAATEPSLYNDMDGDGLSDFDDADDDGDGIVDVDEVDCDQDRIRDDFDLTTNC